MTCFAFPVRSACSSEAGERKKPSSLAEPAGCAETTMVGKTVKANLLPLKMLAVPVISAASSEAGERKRPLSLTEAAEFAEKSPIN
jgi:hypothetical protein